MSFLHKLERIKEYLNHRFLKTYDKGEYIYREGESSKKIYYINKGAVRIGNYTEQGEELLKYILKEETIIGEKSILGYTTRNEFAKTITKTELYAIPSIIIYEIMFKDELFKIEIYYQIYKRYYRLEKRLNVLIHNDIKTRIWALFVELEEYYESYKDPDTGDLILKHPYTQQDLASLIRTSRSRLNIAMKELKELELINYKNYEITINNDQ